MKPAAFFAPRSSASPSPSCAPTERPGPSSNSLKNVIARTGGKCVARLRSWRHATTVGGASATFRSERRLPERVRSWNFVASAGEDALFDAGIYRLRVGRPRGARVLFETGRFDAHLKRFVRFPARRLAPGRYVYSIRFRAEANHNRTTRLTSRPFVIYRAR
jgi:hypothetical protein